MSNQTNRTWIPTDLNAQLHYDNCSVPAIWLARYFTIGDVPLALTTKVIMNGYHGYWNDHGFEKPDLEQVADWVTENLYSLNATGPAEALLDYTSLHCRKEVCQNLPWQGNSDVAGRGMIFAYGSQAVLVTGYLLAMLVSRIISRDFKTARSRSTTVVGSSWRFLERLHEAFHETLRVCLDASLLFSIAMLVAAVVSSSMALVSVRRLKSNGFHSDVPGLEGIPAAQDIPLLSAVQLSAVLALFSIFPAIALHSSAPNLLRRKRYRQVVWLLVGILAVTMFVLSKRAKAEIDDYLYNHDFSDAKTIFENACIDEKWFRHVETLELAVFIVVIIYGVVYAISLVDWCHRRLERFKDTLSFILALSATMAMWAILITFLYFRRQIDGYAGDANENSKWTFGQIIGLGTFAPVVIEILIFLSHPHAADAAEKALTGMMSTSYEVVKSAPKPEEGQNQGYQTLNVPNQGNLGNLSNRGSGPSNYETPGTQSYQWSSVDQIPLRGLERNH